MLFHAISCYFIKKQVVAGVLGYVPPRVKLAKFVSSNLTSHWPKDWNEHNPN